MALGLASRLRGRRGGWSRLACLGLLLLTLGGCVSPQHEQDIGDAMAADINRQLPLVRDPVLNAYVSSLGKLLGSVSSRPDLDYRFFIINSAAINAFALPGGYIYVTRGLLEQTRSGGELAAVLAHEVGHVAARHGVEKLQRYLRTGSLVNFLYTVILGGEPRLLRENALQLAGIAWSASHSREDEAQADKLAVKYLIRAGVNPQAMVSLLESLLREEKAGPKGPSGAEWFSTHPLTETRIALVRRELRQEARATPPPAQPLRIASYPAFLRRVMRLPPPPDAY